MQSGTRKSLHRNIEKFSCIGIPTDKNTLPSAVENLSVDEQFQSKYTIYEGETKPPARYTSGSMVLAMENAGNLIENEELRAQIKSCGIGTEATRAETIKKLVQNEYLALNTKTQVLTPAPYGFCIYEILNSVVPSILNPEMPGFSPAPPPARSSECFW